MVEPISNNTWHSLRKMMNKRMEPKAMDIINKMEMGFTIMNRMERKKNKKMK